MRLPRFHRMLIALVLAAWMPWCLCAWAPNVCGAAQLADAPLGTAGTAGSEASCCTSGCCHEGADEDPSAPTGKRCDTCPSACCAPKFHVVHELPDVPCDGVGLLLPIDLQSPCFVGPMTSDESLAVVSRWPPGRPPGRSSDGRSVLLRSSILRT